MRNVGLLLVLGWALAGCDRGTWWWYHPGGSDPAGIESFYLQATDSLDQDEMIAALEDCGVRRVYGSYNALPEDDIEWMAMWNSKLHANGMESHLLLADPSWLGDSAPLLSLLDDRVGYWYSGAPLSLTPNSFFDALHLDVEPVQFAACKVATLDPVACHGLVEDLRQLIHDVRGWIDSTAPQLELWVDMHHWVDEIGDRVAWPGASLAAQEASRDAWYAAVAADIDGMTVMAYHPSVTTVASRVAWEMLNVSTSVRVGIRSDDYPTVAGSGSMLAAALQLELGPDEHAVDLHSFNNIWALGGCDPDSGLGGPDGGDVSPPPPSRGRRGGASSAPGAPARGRSRPAR